MLLYAKLDYKRAWKAQLEFGELCSREDIAEPSPKFSYCLSKWFIIRLAQDRKGNILSRNNWPPQQLFPLLLLACTILHFFKMSLNSCLSNSSAPTASGLPTGQLLTQFNMKRGSAAQAPVGVCYTLHLLLLIHVLYNIDQNTSTF